MNNHRKLYRSRRHHAIAGVIGGFADYFGWDFSLVRVISVILVLLPGPNIPFFIGYIVAWIIVPLEPGSDTTVIDTDR